METAENLRVTTEVETGKVEEREEVAVPDVEEEMRRALVVAILEELGERKLQQILIEGDRPLNVARQQREVVQPARRRCRPLPCGRKVPRAQRCPFLSSIRIAHHDVSVA